MALAFLFAASALAEGPELPSERSHWVRVETANFAVMTDLSRRHAAKIASELETFHSVLYGEFFHIRPSGAIPLHIVVFKNLEGYEKYSPDEEPPPPSTPLF